MVPEDKVLVPERKQTDQRLHTERAQADQALAARLEVVEENADEGLQRARDKADELLENARDKADRRNADANTSSRSVVGAERAREDETVRAERAISDEARRLEREAESRALAKLLPLERELTDRSLLTERARSDDALASRDDFLSMVSHDLRNLLSAIVTTADNLQQTIGKNVEPESALAFTRRIQRYSARMNRLIGDLLDVGSIDAGALSISPTRADMSSVLHESVESFQVAAAEKQLSLSLELQACSLAADFDHDRMLQVFANLLTNAIKFTPPGGTIRVRCERTEKDLRITFADNGVGIAPALLPAIFERFWQAGKDDRRGVGLGLYIARSIAEAHGGKITATSRLGHGSTFTVTHPAA